MRIASKATERNASRDDDVVARVPDSVVSLLWAKSKRTDDGYQWLPLRQHMIDSQATAELITSHWDVTLPQLFVFLASVHDIGKAHPDFQFRADVSHELPLFTVSEQDIPPYPMLTRSPHAVDSALLLEFWLTTRHHVSDQEAESLALVVGGHHGVTPSRSHLNRRRFRVLEAEQIQPWRDAALSLLDEAYEACGSPMLVGLDNSQIPAMTGHVILADWMASDTFYYPLIPVSDHSVTAGRVTKRHRLPEPAVMQPNDVDPWASVGFDPRPAQQACFETIVKRPYVGGLTIVEAPTGIGKTELALTVAQHSGNTKGVIFTLPTQATTAAMTTRVRSWASHTYPNGVVAEIHGSAPSPRAQGLAAALSNAKSKVLAPMSVCTIDTILLAAARSSHSHLRHAALEGKIIVMDEVHTWNNTMSLFGHKLLRWLSKMGATVIVLTATLDPDQRARLLSAWIGEQVEPVLLDAHPLVTMVPARESYPRYLTINPSVLDERARDITTSALYATQINLPPEGIVLSVHSTVAQAQEYYDEIRQEGHPAILLHSRMTVAHRHRVEKKLLSALGKDGQRPDHLVVVSTQVVEASLDIDADLLVTDVAPFASLVQRAGRLHRHRVNDASRPASMRIPRMIIRRNDAMANLVYGAATIKRSWSVLGDAYSDHGMTWNDPLSVPELLARTSVRYAKNTHDDDEWEKAHDEERRAYESVVETFTSAPSASPLVCDPDDDPHDFQYDSEIPDEERVAISIRGSDNTIRMVLTKGGVLLERTAELSRCPVPITWMSEEARDNLSQWVDSHTRDYGIEFDVDEHPVDYDAELGLHRI